MAYDQAMLMMRGPTGAKLNFPLANYLDANGKLIEDPVIKEKLLKRGSVSRGIHHSHVHSFQSNEILMLLPMAF